MFTKNKYKVIAFIGCLLPLTLTSALLANQQTTNIVQTMQENTLIKKSHEISTFSDFQETNKNIDLTKGNVSQKAANNSQNNFLITVSVLGGVFLSLMVLIISIILKLKNIKKNEEKNIHN